MLAEADYNQQQFNLRHVERLSKALQLLSEQDLDVVLLDLSLPDGNGLDTVARTHAAAPNVPIVVLTGCNDEALAVQAVRKGAQDYLVKHQMDSNLLVRSIRYTIERAKILETLRVAVCENSQLASAITNMTTGVVITDPNLPDNPIIFANPAFTAITGYSAEEIINHNCRFLQGPETDPVAVKDICKVIAQRRSVACRWVLLNYRKDGTTFWNELTLNPVFDNNGKLINFVELHTDVTAQKQAEEALRHYTAELVESKNRYEAVIKASSQILYDWNTHTNAQTYSGDVEKILGYSIQEVSGGLRRWIDLVHPNDQPLFKEETNRVLSTKEPFYLEYRVRRKDNTYINVEDRGYFFLDSVGDPAHMVGFIVDITKRKRAEEQLLRNAFYDTLTGLPNRALFMDRLGHSIERAKRCKDYLFAVLFLDFDHFKLVNDSLGHMTGDQLLIAIARRLKTCLRPGDTVARLGGDEFTILLEDIKTVSNATCIADRIQKELTLPFNLSGHEVFTTVSIGIALSSRSYDRPEDLLRDADTAMYRAKALGRSHHQVFNTAMHDRAVARLQLETDLRWAIERQEFQLHYQPIVALKTGRINGFEALVRWQHPQRKLVSPAEFIPVAEETGLILPISQWVLREACCQMRHWQAQFPINPPLTISVNLSSRQFLQPNLIEQIDQILQEADLDPRSLKLEITESVLVTSSLPNPCGYRKGFPSSR